MEPRTKKEKATFKKKSGQKSKNQQPKILSNEPQKPKVKNTSSGELAFESFDDSSSNPRANPKTSDIPNPQEVGKISSRANFEAKREQPEVRQFGQMKLSDQRTVIIPPSVHTKSEKRGPLDSKPKTAPAIKPEAEKKKNFEDEEWVF